MGEGCEALTEYDKTLKPIRIGKYDKKNRIDPGASCEVRMMSFDTEPTGYEKTLLSKLQDAWQVLRNEVAEQAGFPGWEKACVASRMHR